MGRFKVNKVSVDIQNYLYYIRGIKKSGKTTMFRDLILELFNTPEKGLLIAFKDEVGYKALDEIQAEHVEKWEDFEKLVVDLVKNKKEYGIEFIGLDTVDELVDMAIQRAIKLSAIETGKPCKTLNSAFGGYGAGRIRVTDMIKEQLSLLRKGGYGIMAIGHTKLRTIKEKGGDEEGYQQLTSNLSSDYDGIFADVFDVIATINTERIIENGQIARTERYMHFRNDGFVDCGSRFKGLPDKILLDDDNLAVNFISAIKEGMKCSMKKSMTDKEIEKQRVEEVAVREAKAEEFAESFCEVSNADMIEQIKTKFLAPSTTDGTKSEVQGYLASIGIESFSEPDAFKPAQLMQILEILGQ